jgi:hypothetical protein
VALVKPQYYGLLMFAQAAPPGSHMLVITGTEPRELNVWATRDATGDTRVVLVNNDPARAFDASVRVPNASGPATLTRLQAPALNANDGVSLGDQSFGSVTSTGILATPQATTVFASAPGMYRVTVPEASAALLDVDSTAPSRAAPAHIAAGPETSIEERALRNVGESADVRRSISCPTERDGCLRGSGKERVEHRISARFGEANRRARGGDRAEDAGGVEHGCRDRSDWSDAARAIGLATAASTSH